MCLFLFYLHNCCLLKSCMFLLFALNPRSQYLSLFVHLINRSLILILFFVFLGNGLSNSNFLTLINFFSLNNSKMVRAVTRNFAAFSNILLEIFVPNLVSITCPSLQIWAKLRWGYFRFPDFWSIPYKRKLL